MSNDHGSLSRPTPKTKLRAGGKSPTERRVCSNRKAASAPYSVAHRIIESLAINGVDRVFCVPGESYLPVLDALASDPKVELITCRHEGNAGYMALTDARLSGCVGVCMVSRGPGAANAAIAMHSAEQDCLPFILIVGQVPRHSLRRDAFQEIDYAKMYGAMAKWTAEVSEPSRIDEVMNRAVQAAMSGTPGPVVISLPEDILDHPLAIASPPRPYARPAMAPAASTVDAVADKLRTSRKPLLIAGGRFAVSDGRNALRSLAEAWRLPVVVGFRRHDLFSHAHPLYVGDLGLATTPEQLAAFAESDMVVAAGLRFDELTSQGFTFPRMPYPNQTVIHVYDDPRDLGVHCRPDLGVLCDAVDFARKLAETPSDAAQVDEDWAPRLRELNLRKSRWTPRTAPDGVVFDNVVAALGPRLSKDAIVVADAGLSAALLYQYIAFEPPQMLLGTFVATMGCSVANAIAAAMRHPERKVVCIAGDGGFIMSAAELALAVEKQLDICFIIANNGSYGSIRRDQERRYPGRVAGTALLNPDFCQFAKSFGCEAISVLEEDHVAAALDHALAMHGPVLIDVRSSLSAAMPMPR